MQRWLTTNDNDTVDYAKGDTVTSDSFQVNTVSMLGAPTGSYSFTADDITALSENQ